MTIARTEMFERLAQAQREYLEMLDGADEAALQAAPAEGRWSAATAIAHITEARLFFSQEALRVQCLRGASVGRTPADPRRVQHITEHGADTKDALHAALIVSHGGMIHALEQISEADFPLAARHVKYGPYTLDGFIVRFIVEHNETHVRQAREALRAYAVAQSTSANRG